MATSIFTLLSLPQTSNGFTKWNTTGPAVGTDDGLASRKVSRLDSDLDSASASRSKREAATAGPTQLKVIGYRRASVHHWFTRYTKASAAEPPPDRTSFEPLKRCIRLMLKTAYEPLPMTHNKIYAMCRTMVCTAHMGSSLYDTVKLELEKFVGEIARSLETTDISVEEFTPWLEKFADNCKWFEGQVLLACSLLTYLVQSYVRAHSHLLTIRELAFGQFGDRIFNSPIIGPKLQLGVKSLINEERRLWMTRKDHRDLMSRIVSHSITHNKYDALEKHYLTFTSEWYLAESQGQVARITDAKEFFKKVDVTIEYEVDLVKDVLSVGSWGIVRETTERALMDGRVEWLAKEALGSLLKDKDLTTLRKMYKLFCKVGARHLLRASFRNHIATSVKAVVSDAEHDDTMLPRLLEFKADVDKATNTAFIEDTPSASPEAEQSTSTPTTSPNIDFIYALDEGFRAGFKARRNKPAELIAKHLDKVMRKGQGSSSDADFRALLDSVLALYRYTDDKDVFRTFYHRALAKRLLLEKSASDDFEKEMLKKLKEQYDAEFGLAEDMFKDLDLSKNLMRSFVEHCQHRHTETKLSAMVLQRSAWPFSVPKTTVDLPDEMQKELEEYTKFYKANHQSRGLNWDHALGTVTMKARFKPGPKDLSVSLYQAIVLLLFNKTEEIPFADIKAQITFDDAELRRTLQSLACGKLRVLRKIPMSKDVADTDVFRFNAEFSDPRPKVHINSIQAKVTPEESKRTHVAIEGDRKHYLDAAIVRIMKARKEMKIEELTAETINAVKGHFVPDVQGIKHRIESLVEGEYLARDEEDKKLFRYLA